MFLGIAILLALAALVCGGFGYVHEVGFCKFLTVIFLALTLLCLYLHFNTAQGSRMMKDFKSNTTGGLTRTVEVLDQNGKTIRTFEGKIDVKEGEYGNKVLFDLDGKRVIIYNSPVIVTEK